MRRVFDGVADNAQIEIAGVQRYGLRNLFHWIDHGAPDLGPQNFSEPIELFKRADAEYRMFREKSLMSDTLIATVKKIEVE